MTSKEIYQSIDQSKISPKGKDFLQKAEKSTKGFTIQNDKLDSVMKKLYADLKAKKPEALKDVKTKTVETEVKVPTTKAEKKKEPNKKTKTVKRKVKKATGKKKNTKPTKTPSEPKEGKKEHISTRAKKLADKEGISFKEARARLSKEAKEQIKKDEKEANKELEKLLKFVRKGSFEDGEKYPKIYGKQDPEKASLSADAKRMAKPVGKRISKDGNTYYEYRDNRSDRNSLPTKEGYRYKGKTPPYLEAGGTLPTPFGQAGLVGETGAMNEVDLFAMGGDLPQGVHQYYANTYNPAYPTPHGYAKGGMITSAPEYQAVRNAEYDRRVKSGKIKDTDENFERFDEMYFDELVEKGRIDPNNYFAKGGKMKQGYNDRLDESLGMRDGKEEEMMQSYKDRRDESKGMEKAMGRRAYQSVGTMDKMAKGGNVPKVDEIYKRTYYWVADDKDGNILAMGDTKSEVMKQLKSMNKEGVIRMQKGGEIDAFIMKFIKDAPSSNLKVDAEELTAKLKKGGKLGFEGLAKKVAKRYEGKPVKKQFQNEYGKTYSKAEAMEVGRKVAGKVYREQQAMAKGGKIGYRE